MSAARLDTRPFVFRALAPPSGQTTFHPLKRESVAVSAAQTCVDGLAGPIVVAVDMSFASRRAAVEAAQIAESTGTSLHLVMTVRKPWSLVIAGHGESLNINWLSVAEQFLDNLIRELSLTGVTRTITTGASGQAVEQEAARLNASMVVVRARRLSRRS